MNEEELSVYLHDENGNLDYGRAEQLIRGAEEGSISLERFHEEIERERKALQFACAMLEGESKGNDDSFVRGAGGPLRVGDILLGFPFPTGREERLRNEKEKYADLKEYAIQKGAWYSDGIQSFASQLESTEAWASGKYARVYELKGRSKVLKDIDVANLFKNSPRAFSDYITLHNYLFPETRYDLVGFYENELGLHAIVTQIRIVGKTVKEILGDNYAKDNGVSHSIEALTSGDYASRFKPWITGEIATLDEKITVRDIHGQN